MTSWNLTRNIEMNGGGAIPIGQANAIVGDALAHTWRVEIKIGGAAADLTGWTAYAKIIRPDGATVVVTATIKGNVVEAVLPQACYACAGTARALMRIIKLATGADIVVDCLDIDIAPGETEVYVDPGDTVPRIEEMLAMVETLRIAEAERQAAAGNVIAASLPADKILSLLDAVEYYKTAAGVHLSLLDGISETMAKVTVVGNAGATAALTVCGKNVFNPLLTPTQNYASTYAVVNGVIHYVNADGAARNVIIKCYALRPGKAYTISLANVSGTNIVLSLTQKTAVGTTIGSITNMYETSTPKVIIADAAINYLEIQITSPGTNTACNYYVSLQLEEGSAATDYEAYAGSTTIVNCNAEVERTVTVPMHIFVAGLGNMIRADYRIAPIIDADGQTTADIVTEGDSLTLGGGSASTSYPAILAALTGRTVRNHGVAGETSLTIAGRQGGLPFIVQPFTIPQTATPVAVTLKSAYMDGVVAPLVGGGDSGINPCYINGIKGTLTLSSGVYYFARAVQGNAAVAVVRPTVLITDSMINRRRDITVIWMGTNGGWVDTDGVTYNSDVLVAQIQSMVGYLKTRKFIVIGLTASTAAMYGALDVKLLRTFGRKFLDLRRYILAFGLADAGITATAQDTVDIADGRIPTSLRTDATHFNNAGYTIVANQVYARMLELGYL